jgi:hypothetical protein
MPVRCRCTSICVLLLLLLLLLLHADHQVVLVAKKITNP